MFVFLFVFLKTSLSQRDWWWEKTTGFLALCIFCPKFVLNSCRAIWKFLNCRSTHAHPLGVGEERAAEAGRGEVHPLALLPHGAPIRPWAARGLQQRRLQSLLQHPLLLPVAHQHPEGRSRVLCATKFQVCRKKISYLLCKKTKFRK